MAFRRKQTDVEHVSTLQDNVTQPFEYDLIDWETFGVRIRNEDVPRIPDILGAIHVAEIEKKQKVMAQASSNDLTSESSSLFAFAPGCLL